MRRELGALLLIVACLALKLPDLVVGYRRPVEFGTTGTVKVAGNSESPASAVTATDWKDTGPASPAHRNGQDSVRPPVSSGRASGPARPIANHPPFPRTSPQQVPPCFFEDPLLFFSNAGPESLVTLPGIGPVIAERIAKAASGKRPFTQWEDLLSVKGIGPKKLEKLKRFAAGQ